MKKRFLSILIALCLATQFVPTTALAAQAEAVGNTPAAADVADESDLGADQGAVLGEDQDGLADDEAQALGDQDVESLADDKANRALETSASTEVDQGVEADQADVDLQTDNAAIAAVYPIQVTSPPSLFLPRSPMAISTASAATPTVPTIPMTKLNGWNGIAAPAFPLARVTITLRPTSPFLAPGHVAAM